MPEIEARYNGVIARGYNANERALGNRTPPSIAIQAVSNDLYNFMSGLQNEYRSAFACAEAQAFAKLLGLLPQNPDYSLIEFGRPTGQGGLELWHPCANCSQWLTVKGGFGIGMRYGLSDEALRRLPRAARPIAKLTDDMFPPLSASGF